MIEVGSLEVVMVIGICLTYTFTSLAIKSYKDTYHCNPWIHESAIVALLGFGAGAIIHYTTSLTIKFNNDLFFYLVLPPIIFSAGYGLKKKKFFMYLDHIILFGIIGTVINFTVLAIASYYFAVLLNLPLSWTQAMLLASVLAGSDEVSAMSLIKMSEFPRLGALVFGEGVLNDALSIVLFKTLLISYSHEKDSGIPSNALANPFGLVVAVFLQLLYSSMIGLTCGLTNAFIFKQFASTRKHPIHQVTLLMLFAYLAYGIAEILEVSGILTLFIAAVTMAHYAYHSLSKTARLSSRIVFVSMSDMAEGFAFSYVGLSLWMYTSDKFNIPFTIFMLIMVLLSRLVAICGLSLVNAMVGRMTVIPLREQLAFVLSGVVRGCLCWAQILQIAEMTLLVSTTLVIVMVTTVAGGVLLPIAIPALVPSPSSSSSASSSHNTSHSSSNSIESEMVHVPQNASRLAAEEKSCSLTPNVRTGSAPLNSATAIVTPQKAPAQQVQSQSQSQGHDDSDASLTRFTVLSPNESTYTTHLDYSMDEDQDYEHARCPSGIITPLISLYQGAYYQADHTTQPRQTSDHRALQTQTQTRGANERFRRFSTDTGTAARTATRQFSLLFVLWIRFDELFMKPTFGGSNTHEERQQLLTRTRDMDLLTMMSPIRSVTLDEVDNFRHEEEYDEDDNEDNDDDKPLTHEFYLTHYRRDVNSENDIT